MLDNDIEYIGTNRAPSPGIQMTGSTRALTGFALNVEASPSEPGRRIVFHKRTAVAGRPDIIVGRSPPELPMPTRCDESSAMFRCPVVSRKHAKFHFANGKVYVTDTDSHHGTHVRRPGTLTSTKLAPNTPTELADGDVITFGKT
ncbi:hypothetical protein V5O48_012839, partial [Marasmius crinis-equi]